MSMFDKIKSMMGVPDDDGYDDDGIDYMDEEPEYPQKDDYEFPTAQSAAPRSSGWSPGWPRSCWKKDIRR